MTPFAKRIVAAVLVLVVLGIGVVLFVRSRAGDAEPVIETPSVTGPTHEIIGTSVEGRAIDAYTYTSAEASAEADGAGDTHLLFVGGIHGGYEWNSVLLAYAFMDYLDATPNALPKGLSVTVVPSANPDGVFAATNKVGRFTAADVVVDESAQAQARFNARDVDLNRNFDCKWQPESTWRGQTVSAGTAPFSEPEAVALRDFILREKPDAVVFWHSQSNAVYASECENGILPKTRDVMNAYAQAARYPAVDSFDAYAITGDAEGWLASIGIPAITVELSTHEAVEWERNLAGIKALFALFGKTTIQ